MSERALFTCAAWGFIITKGGRRGPHSSRSPCPPVASDVLEPPLVEIKRIATPIVVCLDLVPMTCATRSLLQRGQSPPYYSPPLSPSLSLSLSLPLPVRTRCSDWDLASPSRKAAMPTRESKARVTVPHSPLEMATLLPFSEMESRTSLPLLARKCVGLSRNRTFYGDSPFAWSYDSDKAAATGGST